MNRTNFNSGDILIAHDRRLNKGCHPIIYIKSCSSTDFIGGMLTHSKCQNNIKIPGSFFIKEQDFTDSYLVRRRFIKFENWGPFTKINQLTPEGVDFVLKQTAEYPEETFYAYYRKLKAR